MVQAVWSTTQGRPLETTHEHGRTDRSPRGPRRSVPRPADSALGRLAVAARARVSLRLRSSHSAPLPVFWLGRRHTGSERVAGLLALGYLAYPWTATSAAASIHPVTFAVPLLLFCVWFLDTNRLAPFLVCAALVLSTGELMGLSVAGLGIWYAFARGRRVAGAVIAVGSAAWVLVAVLLVVPAFSGESQSVLRVLRPCWRLAWRAVTDDVHGSWRNPVGPLRVPRFRIPAMAGRAAVRALPPCPGACRPGAPAASREHALRLPVDDGSPLPQPRCGHSLPHRGDGFRRGSSAFIAPWRSGGGRSRRLGSARARRRSLAARRRPDAVGWSGDA